MVVVEGDLTEGLTEDLTKDLTEGLTEGTGIEVSKSHLFVVTSSSSRANVF